MTPIRQLNALRRKLNVTYMELAATCGLVEDHLIDILEEKTPALEGDIKRIETALAFIKRQNELDAQSE